jgi:hypothetical protein
MPNAANQVAASGDIRPIGGAMTAAEIDIATTERRFDRSGR